MGGGLTFSQRAKAASGLQLSPLFIFFLLFLLLLLCLFPIPRLHFLPVGTFVKMQKGGKGFLP
jgi:hypothetical protein